MNNQPYNVIYDLNQMSHSVIITENYARYNQQLEVIANTEYIQGENYALKQIKDFSYRLIRFEGDKIANWVSRDSGFSPAIHYVNESSLLEAEKRLKFWINDQLPKLLESGFNTTIYQKMVKASHFYNLPEHYKEDFTYHDLHTIATIHPQKFIWILRNCGSWLIRQNNDFGRSILDNCKRNSEHQEYFIYDNGKLKHTNPETALHFLNTEL